MQRTNQQEHNWELRYLTRYPAIGQAWPREKGHDDA